MAYGSLTDCLEDELWRRKRASASGFSHKVLNARATLGWIANVRFWPKADVTKTTPTLA